MAEDYIDSFKSAVSGARFNSYRIASEDDIDTVVNYLWNIALSQSLYPTLCALEITLRNAMHLAISDYTGTPYWFDEPGILLDNQVATVVQARESIRRRRKEITADRLVAELSFGFWTLIMSGPYHRFWMRDRARMLRRFFLECPLAQEGESRSTCVTTTSGSCATEYFILNLSGIGLILPGNTAIS